MKLGYYKGWVYKGSCVFIRPYRDTSENCKNRRGKGFTDDKKMSGITEGSLPWCVSVSTHVSRDDPSSLLGGPVTPSRVSIRPVGPLSCLRRHLLDFSSDDRPFLFQPSRPRTEPRHSLRISFVTSTVLKTEKEQA